MANMKKLTALFLAATMTAGALVGCGGGKDSKEASSEGKAATESGSEEGGEKTESGEGEVSGKVEFWNDKMAEMEQEKLDHIFNTINDATGNTVEMLPYPDTAAYQTAMQQTIKEDKAPGLFTWWSGPQLQTLAENGLIEDLTDVWNETIFDAGVSQGVADAFTFDGKIYAAPWSVLYNTVLYNKEVFDECGVKEPETFDEFLQVCETLKSKGVTPIALKSDSWAGFIWFQALLAAKDVELYHGVCDGSIKYTDERVVEVMKIWQDMLEKEYFSVPMKYGTDVRSSFAKGTVAMMLEPHVEMAGLGKDFGMVEGENMDSFVVPSMDGGKRTIFFEAAPLCVSANSAQKEIALDTLKNWYDEDVQGAFNEEMGYTNTSKVKVEGPVSQEIIQQTGDAENYQLVLRYYESTPAELRDFALDELMKFQLQDATAEETMAAIQAEADKTFGN
ncbi:MAG: extracellular solute-binding protein [Clostridiales bacterium]|nr:extracellular solute-binding protein [Clostridiales bacterium]